MEFLREAVCRLCWKEKVSDMDVMKKAISTGSIGKLGAEDENPF